jgi:hypothetical protein
MLERLADNRNQDYIKDVQERNARGEEIDIPFGSSVLLVELPFDEELAAIEDRGYDPEWMQNYIDYLQTCHTGDPGDIRAAYTLRGTVNQLIDRISELEGGA